MSIADIFAEPHYREREMILQVPTEGGGPQAQPGTLAQPGVVPKLSRTPGRVTHAGGALDRQPTRSSPAPPDVGRGDRRAARRRRGVAPR